MVMLGHSHDITPLLTSLASSKSFDVSMTEGAVVVGMVITNLTDASGFAAAMGDLAIDLIVSSQSAQETLLYVVAVEGVVCCLVTPFTVFEPWLRLLIPRVFNGI